MTSLCKFLVYKQLEKLMTPTGLWLRNQLCSLNLLGKMHNKQSHESVYFEHQFKKVNDSCKISVSTNIKIFNGTSYKLLDVIIF